MGSGVNALSIDVGCLYNMYASNTFYVCTHEFKHFKFEFIAAWCCASSWDFNLSKILMDHVKGPLKHECLSDTIKIWVWDKAVTVEVISFLGGISEVQRSHNLLTPSFNEIAPAFEVHVIIPCPHLKLDAKTAAFGRSPS